MIGWWKIASTVRWARAPDCGLVRALVRALVCTLVCASIWALASVAPAMAADAAAPGSEAAHPAAVLDAFARGERVALSATPSTVARRPPPAPARAAAELLRMPARLAGAADREAALRAAVEQLAAVDRAARAHFAAVRAQLAAAHAAPVVSARLDAAEARYHATLGATADRLVPLLTVAEGDAPASLGPAVARQLTDALAALPPPPPRPIHRALPYRPLDLAPRPPRLTPVVTPSYLDPAAAPASSADLQSSPETRATPEILAQAAALDYDYARIYDFVRNDIAREWYAGAVKGAAGTLAARAGNDVDQASLLIALFRASQLPARYVQGVVRLPVAEVAASLGLGDDQQVPAALAAAGVAYQVVLAGGRVGAVEVEHTWVAAYPPYANYRGVVVDFSGPVWVPLAPAIHGTDWQRPTGVLAAMPFDGEAFTAAYLATVQPLPPLALVRQEVEAYLLGTGGTYDEQLGGRGVAERRLELLPSTLPAPVVAVTHEAPTLPAETFHQLRFELRAGADPDSPVSLDHTFDLNAVTGRRLTLSYTPATAEDDAIVNAYGGLDSVPPYLVAVLPQLKLGGRLVATGTVALPLALPHRAATILSGPGFSQRHEHLALAGGYSALAVSAPGDVAHLDPADDPADTEHLAARLLNQLAQRFAAEWGAAEEELAALLDLGLVRPSAALAFAHNSLRVDLLFDIPLRMEWEGVTLDAAHRIAQPLANDEPAAPRQWWTLAALHGSALERFVFEHELQVAAVSADAGLGRARDLGLEVAIVTGANVDAVLAAVELAPEVEEAVRQLALAGFEVELPLAPLAYDAWQGAVWRAVDPETGAAGHFISGGLAGGATATPPGDWILGFLADALAAPYSGEPNDDPLAGVAIDKLPAGDHQRAAVGAFFPLPLEVRVQDRFGRPVRGAEVVFTSWAGGGLLLDAEGNEAPVAAALTDARGVAVIGLRAGTDTAANPAWVLERPEDEFASRALRHEVLAWVANRDGGVGLAEAFVGLAFPGAVTHLIRIDSEETHFLGQVGLWSDTIPIEARDAHGNPVANYPIVFEVGPPGPQDETCSNQSSDFLNAAVFDSGDPDACPGPPVIGACGAPFLPRTTSAEGARGGVILGSSSSALYTVAARPDDDPDVAPVAFTYAAIWDQQSASGRCSPYENVETISIRLSDAAGHNIQAAPPGTEYPPPIDVQLLGWDADEGWICTPLIEGGCGAPYWWGDQESGSWVPAWGNMAFTVDNGGSATLPLNPATGLYRLWVTTGPTPGLNVLSIDGTEVRWEVQLGCPTCTLDCPAGDCEADCEGSGYPEYCRLCPLCTLDCPGAGCTNDCDPLDPPLEACEETGRGRVVEVSFPRFESPWTVNEVWGVEAGLTAVAPTPVPLSDDGGLLLEASVGYAITPEEYIAGDAEVEILVDGEWNATAQGTSLSGAGDATVQRGFPLSLDHENTAELVLNRGLAAELRSAPLAIPLAQTIFRPRAEEGEGGGSDLVADRRLAVSQDVDLVNQRYCSTPDLFFFAITQEAHVTLRFEKLGSLDPDGTPVYEAAVDFLDGELLTAGEHLYTVTSGNGAGDLALAPGDYRFTLSAISTASGVSEEIVGTARSELRTQDHLPIGHVLVEGVDLFDGHLTLGRTDLSVPGRGPALEFRRSFSSAADRDLRALGLGWTHNYDSHLTITRCGEVVLVGGEGSGMRFVDDGGGGLAPLEGHHGTLIANQADSSFDFYSKNGTRHHYAFDARAGHWLLDHVTDTNGNRTQLTYDSGAVEPLLLTVTDPAGRRLDFHYENRAFFLATELELASRPMLVQVTGPEGLAVAFDYDGGGHLTSAAREGDARRELYGYATVSDPLVPLRQALVGVTNALDGGTTGYQYQAGVIGVTADVEVPRLLVTRVTRPEGGATGFVFDLGGLASRDGPELVHQVIDPRAFPTTYRLDQYGAPLAVIDPLGNTTAMTWTPDDVLMASRTDANGHTTAYTYDAHGNRLSESITVTDVDGQAHAYQRLSTYHPPTAFDPPHVKERLASRIDRNGQTTTFDYDSAGNLTRVSIQVGPSPVTTLHSYLPNGDRASTTDPRQAITQFTYDAYGNLATTRDPLTQVTSTEWDARGRPVRRVDALGRETRFAYDTLDRLVTTIRPLGAVESVAYDDAADTVSRTDAEGRITVERFDREGRPIETIDPALARRLTSYDAAGNKILETSWFDALTPPQETLLEYDPAGRLTRRLEPLGRTTELVHDAVGNVVRETLRDTTDSGFAPRVSETDYDALDRPIRRRRFLAATAVETKLLLDGEGNLLAETDPLGRVTEHGYDALDRRVETLAPEWRPGERRRTTFDYDGNGNLVREVLANVPVDQQRTFAYDPLDRLVTRTSATGGATAFEYDAVGNLLFETDPNGNRTAHTYDALDRRATTVRHLTRVSVPPRTVTTSFGYDLVGNLVSEQWPNGNLVTHVYDLLDRRIATTDGLGPISTATYDARGNRLTATDANGNPTTSTYDALDRLVAQELPESRTVSSVYDVAANRVATTDARGHTTELTFDTLDRQTAVLYASGESESATFDLAGNRLSATNRRGLTTTFAYDALDRLKEVTDPTPLAFTTAYTYDAAGNRLSETDRRGIVGRSDYDAENRLVRLERDGLTLRTLSYDAAGDKVEEIDAEGRVTTFEYDERHLPTATRDPLTPYVSLATFDDMGDRVTVHEGPSEPGQLLLEESYDLRRRLVIETRGGETTTYELDGNGNRTAKILPLGNRWEYDYDGADRLMAVRDPLLAATTYTYDGNGNLTGQTDAEQRTTTFTYDLLDRRLTRTYPDGAGGSVAYDPNGNPASETDAMGRTTLYQYDALDRRTLATFELPQPPLGDDLLEIATAYDPNGNPTSITETYSGATGTRATTRAYDTFDRPTAVTDPFGETLAYTYTASGLRATLTDPDGRVTRYTYDGRDRPVRIEISGGEAVTYAYQVRDWVSRLTYPHGITADHIYDSAGRKLQILHQLNGVTWHSQFDYTYDANGNRLTQREQRFDGLDETTSYLYDDADRLLEVAYPDRTVTHTYDGVGNRLSELVLDPGGAPLADRAYSYNARHQLTAITDHLDPAASTSYAYDANGNQTGRTVGGETTEFTFDVRNRLARILDATGTPLGHYLYDYQGLRVEKTAGGDTRRYTYDDQSLLLATDPTGATRAKYDYGADRLITLDDSASERQYYLFDALGSVVELLEDDYTSTARYQWDAWGRPRGSVGASANAFGFTGYQRDTETGLDYAKARYYDAEVGRFLSEDPVGGTSDTPPSLHRYLYGYSNPTVWVDPSGNQNELLRNPNSGAIVLREGEPIPEGYIEVDTDHERLRLVVPGEEPGFIDRTLDFLANLNFFRSDDAIEEFGNSFDRAEASRRNLRDVMAARNTLPQAAAASRTLEDATGVGVALFEDAINIEGAASGIQISGGLFALAGRASSSRAKREVAEEVLHEIEHFASSERARNRIDLFNARTSRDVTNSVLETFDLSKTAPNTRFGRALYLSEHSDTAVLEVTSHGGSATQVIRYELDLARAEVLDLTNPATARQWGYLGGENLASSRAVAARAQEAGFNAIKYPSLRGEGSNYAILDDIDDLLKPQMVTPATP